MNLNAISKQLQRIETMLQQLVDHLIDEDAEPDHSTISDVIEMATYGNTWSTGSDMWKCMTQSGRTVYIFKHDDPGKDNYHLFKQAGWSEELERSKWSSVSINMKIPVHLGVADDRWKIVSVDNKQIGEKPIDVRELELVLQNGNLVVLDTETATLYGEVIQVGIYCPEHGSLVDTLVKPTGSIEPGATRVHGITDAMVADALSFAEVSQEIIDAVRGKVIIGWNIDYDINCLLHSHRQINLGDFGKILSNMNTLDVMQVYSDHVAREWSDYHRNYKWQRLESALSHYENYKWQTLESALSHYEITIAGNAHDAISDAIATYQVAKAVVDDFS
jgi:DNA polymerase III subunit epsilon